MSDMPEVIWAFSNNDHKETGLWNKNTLGDERQSSLVQYTRQDIVDDLTKQLAEVTEAARNLANRLHASPLTYDPTISAELRERDIGFFSDLNLYLNQVDAALPPQEKSDG